MNEPIPSGYKWLQLIPQSSSISASSGEGRSCNWLIEYSLALRLQLNALSVGPGDRVINIMPQGDRQIVASLAATTIAIVAPLAPESTRADIENHIAKLLPKVALIDSTLLEKFRNIYLENGVIVVSLYPDMSMEVILPDEMNSTPMHWLDSPRGPGMLLPTSGTTGTPKLVYLSTTQLLKVAGRIAKTLGLGNTDRYLCVLPGHHIHALSTVMASLISGGSITVTNRFSPAAALGLFQKHRITWMSATPTHYRSLLSIVGGPTQGFEHLRFLRSASAPMDEHLSNQISSSFAVPLIQAYGMTEAGPLICSNSQEPRGNRPGSVGVPRGVSVSIRQPGDEATDSLAGEIWIRGETVSTQYWELGSTDPSEDGGWLNTGDLGFIDKDGFLFVTGRKRDIINSGGEKLIPLKIEAALMQHPAVDDAAVYPAPHQSLGESPNAAIVLSKDYVGLRHSIGIQRELIEEVRLHCVSLLAASQVPHRIDIYDSIPRNPAGKIQRQKLFELLICAKGPPGCSSSNKQVSRDIGEAIERCWRSVLSPQLIHGADNFFSLGGDSLTASQLTLDLEGRFKIKLSDDFFLRCPSLDQQTKEIAGLCDGKSDASIPVPGISRFGDIAPLSPGQRRLWIVDQLGAGPEYTMCAPVWINGSIDFHALENALKEVVRRHSALRTSIRLLDSKPVQYIERALDPSIVLRDVRANRKTDEIEEVLGIAREERSHKFNLALSPPVRYTLVRVGESKYAFIMTIHHIVCDGWSVPVFFRDLFTVYSNAFCSAHIALPEISQNYHDFCYDQNDYTHTAEHKEKLDWWCSQLKGVEQALPLFPINLNSGLAAGAAAERHLCIDRATTLSLRNMAQNQGKSLYPILMAALQLTIFMVTGKSKFCLGTVNANRSKREYQDSVGFFANTLAIPALVEPEARINDFLDQVARVCVGAISRGDVDFGQVVGRLDLDHRGTANSLIEVMFAYQSYPSLGTRLSNIAGDFDVTPFQIDSASTKFELTLYLTPDDDTLAGNWQYRTSRFCEADIDRINEIFLFILKSIPTIQDKDIGDLKRELVPAVRTNPGPREGGESDTLLTRICMFATSAPDSVAIRCDGATLSYSQLYRRIDSLSGYLKNTGIRQGARIGVLLPRNDHAVVAALSIWSCGATYIPLDCSYPEKRMEYMCKDSGMDYLVLNNDTCDAARKLKSTFTARNIINLDSQVEEIRSSNSRVELASTTDNDIAYIIYTSGSTGRPKGVKISYANILHYFSTMATELAICKDDVYLHTASLSFSSSIRQFALPLYCGASVYIASREDVLNAIRIPQLVEAVGITILDLVPSHWRNVLRALEISNSATALLQPDSLRLLLSASEALSIDLAKSLVEYCPSARLVSMYGQTETAGIVLVNVNPLADSATVYVQLGRPTPDTDLIIVDEHDNEVAQGRTGELIVMGSSVGQGYIAEDNNSDAAFFKYHGKSAYRTGDRVRSNNLGEIQYVGRSDSQVKHRGVRIDLGEIESIALQQSFISEASACLMRSSTNSTQLHLFFCSEHASETESEFITQLKSCLAAQLPAYMLPTTYTRLEKLPRNTNGKVDRNMIANTAPIAATIGLSVRPQGNLIERLVEVWKEVLSVENVSTHDNFFDLGGDSISIIEIVGCALDAGIPLTLEMLFQYQTISQLAGVLDQSESVSSQPAIFEPEKSSEILPSKPIPDREERTRFTIDSLRDFSLEALCKAGLAEEGARILTEVQLESSLRGQATHNIADIPRYARRLSRGVLNGQPNILVTDTSPVSATIDGDNAPGQWVATLAMNKAIAIASTHGIGVVGVRRSNHYGAAGQYAWQATQSGFIGLCFTNGPVVLAPSGGTVPLFGNNPLAIGIPRAGTSPFILDIAMSVATRGKIGLTVAEGKPLEPGWILDRMGIPSTSLGDLSAGLAAPIGGHKGYGLAFAIEILAGALTGSGYCADHSGKAAAKHGGSDIGHLFVTLSPELLMPADVFQRRIEDIVDQTKSSSRVAGVEEIFVPGEIEMRERERNLVAGIPLHDSAVKRLMDYGVNSNIQSEIVKAVKHDES